MPNYTWNTIKAKREVLEKLLNKNGEFTFNNFIKKPQILNYTVAGGHVTEMIVKYLIENFEISEVKSMISKMNLRLYGLEGDLTIENLKKRIGDKVPDFEGTHDKHGNILHPLSGKDYVDIFNKYGYIDWYDWSCDKWGTKWDAFDVDVDLDNEAIYFTTAWSRPEPIFQKICKKFNNEEIEFISEYEDNFLCESKNLGGCLVDVAEYEHRYQDYDTESDDFDWGSVPWINIKTGEERAS